MAEATQAVAIGEAEVRRGHIKKIGLPHAVRDRHLYIIGKTRMGKSTLITNIAHADIMRGSGVCVIDPHGDLVEDLLNSIPEHRIKDTIYFNANDKERPIPLNILQAQNEEAVTLLADNLHVTFRRLSETWGQRMDDILRATLQTLALTPQATFGDIKRLLQDPSYRERITKNLDHPMLKDFWQIDFPAYPKDAITPIISRVNRFLYAPHFYKMFSTSKGALSISQVIEEKKILLVNLASGAIGDDNATLLGSLFVSQIQQAIMGRAALPRDFRVPYFLFVDEFQNFTNSGFDKILSEAGKYKLCLTLAHQFISQLSDAQRDAIFGNVGTMIMFGVGDKDAMALRNQIGNFEPTDLLNLAKYHALCRPTTAARDTFLFKTLAPPSVEQSFAAQIIEYSRERYGIKPPPPVEEEPTPIEAAPVAAIIPPVIVLKPEPIVSPTRVIESLPQSQIAAIATPLELTRKEKILYYLEQATYLKYQQIIDLCFADLKTEGSRKKSASTALGELKIAKKVSTFFYEREQIVHIGKRPNVRGHDLAVREIFTKIAGSNVTISNIQFFQNLDLAGKLNPDLSVDFQNDNGKPIKTFWEYDSGTEGMKELKAKIDRYQPYFSSHIVVFVFETEGRIKNFLEKVGSPRPPLRSTVLSTFTNVLSPCFHTIAHSTESLQNGSNGQDPLTTLSPLFVRA